MIFLVKVVSDLKFGHFYFFGPHLTSATSEVGWKTSKGLIILPTARGVLADFWVLNEIDS